MLDEVLQERLKGKVVLVGIGNTLRADDGFGPRILSALEGRVQAGLLDVGEVPESYVGRIREMQPQTVVLLDAANFGGEPGAVAVLEAEDLAEMDASTHRPPMPILLRYIQQETGADVFVLGVQPGNLNLGEEMGPEVTETVEDLSAVLLDVLNGRVSNSNEPDSLPAIRRQVNS